MTRTWGRIIRHYFSKFLDQHKASFCSSVIARTSLSPSPRTFTQIGTHGCRWHNICLMGGGFLKRPFCLAVMEPVIRFLLPLSIPLQFSRLLPASDGLKVLSCLLPPLATISIHSSHFGRLPYCQEKTSGMAVCQSCRSPASPSWTKPVRSPAPLQICHFPAKVQTGQKSVHLGQRAPSQASCLFTQAGYKLCFFLPKTSLLSCATNILY